jgi:hypothetical protein
MQVPDDLGGKGNRLNHKIVCGKDSNQTKDQEFTEEGRAKHPKPRTWKEQFQKSCQKNGARWSDHEDATLLSFAGEKSARELAKLLGRTERGVYCRLARLSLSSTVKDGYTPRLLAEDLHVDRGKVRQWLLDGKLESQGFHVTRSSIKKLCERGDTEIVWKGKVLVVLGRAPQRVLETLRRGERKSGQNHQAARRRRGITQSYTFRRAGRILQVNQEAMKQLVAAGVLKLSRLRIEEDALNRFVRKYPLEINWQLLDPEMLAWLGVSRIDDGTASRKLPGALKHLVQVRTCPGCHHSCRGNGYWTHVKFCLPARDLEPEVLQWAAEHPRSAVPSKLAGFGRMEVKVAT